MNIFDILYTKILDTKEKLNKNNGLIKISVDNNSIIKNSILDLSKGLSIPLDVNTSCIYLYDDILRTLMVNGNFVIDIHKKYSLLDFMNITKTLFLIFSDGKVVDPSLISLYITRERLIILTINGNVTNVEIMVSKGIQSCTRYAVNTSVTLDTKYLNSYIIYTDGTADYIEPVINGSTFTLTLQAQGKIMLVIVSDFIKMYKATPISNSIYNYINFLEGINFVATDYIFIHEQGISGYSNPVGYTQLYDGFLTTDAHEKIVICFLRYGIGKYEDIRNYYNTFKDFTAEYIAGTLPQYLQDYTPYLPQITENMSFANLKTELIKASKDLPNFYRKYLEENNQFNITERSIVPILTTFERNSIINSEIGLNVPRYITEEGLSGGIIIEDAITNILPDPLFEDEIDSQLNDLNWSIPYQQTVSSQFSVVDGVLHHSAILSGTDLIELISPKISFDKTRNCIIQFKIKYVINTMSKHSLMVIGGIVDNIVGSIVNLDSYIVKSNVLEDGFVHNIYKIPANTFSGSSNVGYIGLWGELNQQYETVDYFLKDVQITNTDHYPYFYPGIKADETLKLSNANILNKTEGSVELWVKPRSYNKNGFLLYSVGNNIIRDFSIMHTSNGRLVFNMIGTTSPPHNIISDVDVLVNNALNYIVIGWKDNILYGYLNGVLIGTATITDEPGIGSDIMIGSRLDKSFIGDFSYHDIRFSTILRTPQEILYNYTNMQELIVDDYTSYRIPFKHSMLPDKNVNHSTTINFKTNPADLLMFNNQLNISPSKIVRQGNSSFIAFFRAMDIVSNNIQILDIGRSYSPYYIGAKVSNQTVVLQQSSKIGSDDDIAVYITGVDVKSVPVNQRIYSIIQNSDGYVYACINTIGKVYKYNPMDLSVEAESQYLGESIPTIVINNNKLIVGVDHKLLCLNPETLAIEHESPDFGGDIIKLCMGINNELYMIGGSDLTTVKKLNPTDFSIIASSATYGGNINAIVLGFDNTVYIGGSTTQKVYKLNSQSLIKEGESSNYNGVILTLAFNINGAVYVGGDTRNTILQLSANTLDVLSESISCGGTIQTLCVGNDGSIYSSNNSQDPIYHVYKHTSKLVYVGKSEDHTGLILSMCKGFDDSIYACGELNTPIVKYNILSLEYSKRQYFEQITNFTHSNIDGISTINFADSSINGKNVHMTTKRFNRLISKAYSGNSLVKLPTWASFIDADSIITFLKGYHISNTNTFVFNPYKHRVIGKDTVLSINIDTDIKNGETINVLLSSNIEYIEQITVSDNQKILELSDKSFPFSDKYNLVFADGKLVLPTKIKIIDTYRFSIDIDSIHDVHIYRKKLFFEYDTDFNAIVDRWSELLATLQISDVEDIIGPLFSVKDIENNARTPVLLERHLFEILYWYMMKDKISFTFVDNFNIREDLPDIFTTDGRLPLSNIRLGNPPRYIL